MNDTERQVGVIRRASEIEERNTWHPPEILGWFLFHADKPLAICLAAKKMAEEMQKND